MKRRLRQWRDAARLLDEAVVACGFGAGLRIAGAVRRAGRAKAGLVELRVPGLPAPIALRAGTSDAATFVQIFLRGDLGFPLAHAPSVIVDGGANIGLSALYLHRRFPTARIVAVEFERSNFDLLARNVAAYPQIEPVLAGLWPSDGWVAVADEMAAKWATMPRADDGASPRSVRAVSLTTLMAERALDRIDLLKLDLEGSEYELFDRLPPWLDAVGTLAIELHERLRPGASRRVVRALAGCLVGLQVQGEYLVCELGRAR
jgi:FkbM family methyltransferase